MDLQDVYTWEIETVDGQVYQRDGKKRWQEIEPETVLRASLVPQSDTLQRIDVFCSSDNRFVGWFGKGFLKQVNNFQLSEYAQCLETDGQRVWVLSGGQVMITHPEFELRL